MPSPARDPSPDLRVWFLEPFARLPLPVWAIGLLISLTIVALNVVMESLYMAADPAHRVLVGTVDLVGGLVADAFLLGYLPTAVWYAGLAFERTDRTRA